MGHVRGVNFAFVGRGLSEAQGTAKWPGGEDKIIVKADRPLLRKGYIYVADAKDIPGLQQHPERTFEYASPPNRFPSASSGMRFEAGRLATNRGEPMVPLRHVLPFSPHGPNHFDYAVVESSAAHLFWHQGGT